MNKEFIPYEQALELKELGFDEPCFKLWQNENTVTGTYRKSKNWILTEHKFSSNYFYNNSFTHPKAKGICSAPLYQQAFRFFREKYKLCLVIKPISDINLSLGYNLLKNGLIIKACTTYEEAELACLVKLISIVKEQQNEKHLFNTNR